jgi:hypothetical protein
MKKLTVMLTLTLGVVAAGSASAECKDDIASVQAKIAAGQSLMGLQHLGETGTAGSVTRGDYATAKSWIAKAIDVEPVSEIECRNDLARAKKALVAASQASPQDRKQAAQPQGPVPQPEPDAEGGAPSPKD